MKHLTSLIAASVLALGLASAPAFAADTYALDARHTSVTFQYTHFGLSRPTGKFMNAVGKVTLDDAAPANSSVEVSFALDGLSTGVKELDAHLLSPDFFDAAKYPTATFKSTKVELTGADTAKVTGDLTLHGVTKPVTFDVKLNKRSDDKKKAGFSATGFILRSEFGITKYIPGGSDQIDLYIEAESVLQ
ncbi:hypothetical protein ABAC460_09715 [Asticcacaulis sp. AC460]|uniref:YceI family protein n=1 Tax=Asticcacaulis sp. AC460 TaxID=1282360 RepID=UPI0003C3DAEC|nr:YceI family protein [Asticcacaulis sp. AC460]ESQ90034.1 hypothetical protein ABAC460_09715 [Asticcacaulis sp. AC460]